MVTTKKPAKPLVERPMCITMVHSTSDNSVHGRRREKAEFGAVSNCFSPQNTYLSLKNLLSTPEKRDGGGGVTYVREPD